MFEGKRDALTPPDTERDQPPAQPVPPHRVDKLRGEHSTRCPDRVAMSNGTSLHIDNLLRQSKPPCDHNGDGGKSLVDLHPFHRPDIPAGALQRLPDGWDRAKAEHSWFHS